MISVRGFDWSRSWLFRFMIGLGAVKGTLVATLAIDLVSLTFAIITMAVLHRLSWMGVFISGTLPLMLVPLHWYPFMRISEQLHRAETRLRASEERYRSILERMSEAYVETDQRGRLTFFNDSLCRMTGHSRAELEGRRIDEFLSPAARRRLIRSAVRVRDPGRIAAVYDLPIAARDGVLRNLVASIALLRDQQGAWRGYHAVVFDATEKIADENEKRALERRLLRAQRMESLGILAGGVAHDLNNILCGLVGYPDLLLLECGQDEFLRSSLLAIKESGEKASAVVQDLLTLSRRGVVMNEVVNLNQIVAGYLSSQEFAHLAESHPQVSLTSSLDPSLRNIEGSSIHLFKTVMNLVLNSFEAIVPPGTVRLSTANRRLDRPVKGYDHARPGEYVTLSVEDSGIGISAEDAERIFEPFFTRKVLGRSGSGLGLAVVWGTVKDHRGCIFVESEPGRGTTIQLYFPACQRELPEQPPGPAIEEHLGRREHVLVIDDLQEQRSLLSQLLSRLGYRVQVASGGEEALAYLKRDGPADLVILDMIMDPGMDGLDTYRGIRDLRPGLRVILASGFSETDRVREALRLGAGPYLKKPYRLEHLARVVDETLHA